MRSIPVSWRVSISVPTLPRVSVRRLLKSFRFRCFHPTPGMTAADLVNLLGSGCPGLVPVITAPRSFADVGVLPPGLDALRYDSADPESELWSGDNLRFRFLVRQVGFGGGESGIQGFLVVSTPDDIPQSERYTQDLMRYAGIPEAGVIVSNDPLDPSASGRVVRGYGGGWELEVCDSGGGVTGFASCASSDLASSSVLDLGTVIQNDAVISAFRADVASPHTPAGGRPGLDTPTARLVAVNSLRRETALRNVLYRTDIGIPGANRMQAPLDMGGMGFFNAAFVMGPDADSDGKIDSGLQIIGPPAGSDPADVPHPTRVFGDLVVTGNIYAGRADPPVDAHTAGGTIMGVRVAAAPADGVYPFDGVAENAVGMGVFHNVQVGDGDAGEVTASTALAAPDVQGKVWLQGLQVGRNDIDAGLVDTTSPTAHADTSGLLYADRGQFGQDSATAPGVPAIDPVLLTPAASGRLWVQAFQAGQDAFAAQLADADARGRAWVQALQAGQPAYRPAMHAPNTEGAVHARNVQAGHEVLDPNVVFDGTDRTDGRVYAIALQARAGGFDQALGDGAILADSAQLGRGAYQTDLTGTGSLHAEAAQLGVGSYQPDLDGTGSLHADAAQLGVGAYQPGLDGTGSLHADAAQLGVGAYQPGLDGTGSLHADAAQLGVGAYQPGLDGTGSLHADAAQLGVGAYQPGLDGTGSLHADAAQLGVGAYQPGLDGTGSLHADAAQLGVGVYQPGLDGTGSLHADAAQLGSGNYQPGLDGTGSLHADAAQLGVGVYQPGLDGTGSLHADAAQLGSGNYQPGLDGTGSLHADAAQLGSGNYQPGLHDTGSLLADAAQLGHGAYKSGLTDTGALHAEGAQVGSTAAFDTAVAAADQALLVTGKTALGGSTYVRGAKVAVRTDASGSAATWATVETAATGGVGSQSFAVTDGAYTPSPGAKAFIGFGGGHTDGSVEIQTLHSKTKVGTHGGRFGDQYALGAALPRIQITQTERPGGGGFPADPCPGLADNVALPHGWRTSSVAGEFKIELGLTIPPHGIYATTLGPFRDPYVGWSSDSQTGDDNSVGKEGTPQTVATLLYLCDYS